MPMFHVGGGNQDDIEVGGRVKTPRFWIESAVAVSAVGVAFGYGQLPPYLTYLRVSPDGELVRKTGAAYEALLFPLYGWDDLWRRAKENNPGDSAAAHVPT